MTPPWNNWHFVKNAGHLSGKTGQQASAPFDIWLYCIITSIQIQLVTAMYTLFL